MPTVTTTGELTLSITVKDRGASAAWFKEHFGFEEVFSIEEAGWTELSTTTPGVTLGLGDSMEQSPGNCVPVFSVEDIAASQAALTSVGTKFDGDIIHIEGMVKLLTFYDPDGNAFMLAENLMS